MGADLPDKSSPSKKIHLQLLKYLIQIYEKMKNLSPVIPLVFYHGKQKWNISRSFHSQFDYPDDEIEVLRPYIPDFYYEILDLNEREIDSLIMSLTVKVISYTLKNIWKLESDEVLRGLITLARDLFYDRRGLEIIRKLLIYIYHAREIKPEKIRDEISRFISEDKGEIAMTTAELLEKKGRKEGKLEDARNMLAEGISLKIVLKVTGLSKEDLLKAGILDSR